MGIIEIQGEGTDTEVWADDPKPTDGRKNVVRKKPIQVSKDGKPGDIAHYHKKENDTEEWDDPCYYVEHQIKDARGFSINEHRYVGRVIVPQCMADQLAWQEAEHLRYEQGVYRGKLNTKLVGQY